MKRILYFLLIALCVSACAKESSYSETKPYQATFEYYDVIFGADSLWVNAGAVGIPWAQVLFMHKLDGDEFLGGFRLSCLKGSGAEEGNNAFRAVSGSGSGESSSYLVFYDNPVEEDMPEHDFQFINAAYGSCTVVGFYVNNTAEVADYVKANFGEDDKLTLTATGYIGTEKTGEAEFQLAEKGTFITDWTPFNLSALGSVEYIDFKVTSTQEGVPPYFCMDDFFMSVSISY